MDAEQIKKRLQREVRASYFELLLEHLGPQRIQEAAEDGERGYRDLRDEAVELAEFQRRSLARVDGYTGQRPGRLPEPSVEDESLEEATELTEYEAESARAYSKYLAIWASKRDDVIRFRNQVLDGQLLSREEALTLVTSQAAAIFSLTTFEEKKIPLTGHAARAECKDWGRHGDWGHHHIITVYVEPPGIELSRKIDERTSSPHKYWFPFEFIDEEGNIAHVGVHKFSVLDRLRKVSNLLARNYPWEPAYAAYFVLTGEPPKVSPLWGQTRDGAITLTISPWVSGKTVSRFYRYMQRQVHGGDNRPLTDRARAVLLFVSEHWVRQEEQPPGENWRREGISWWRPSWSKLHELWNERYPQWAYKQRDALYKAHQRAHRVLLSKDQPPAW